MSLIVLCAGPTGVRHNPHVRRGETSVGGCLIVPMIASAIAADVAVTAVIIAPSEHVISWNVGLMRAETATPNRAESAILTSLDGANTIDIAQRVDMIAPGTHIELLFFYGAVDVVRAMRDALPKATPAQLLPGSDPLDRIVEAMR